MDQLSTELQKLHNISVEIASPNGSDLIVKNADNGREVLIDIKNAGRYGELPISTIIPLANLVKRNPNVNKFFLVSFSNLPGIFESKLKELNIQPITNPNIDKVVEQVQKALTA